MSEHDPTCNWPATHGEECVVLRPHHLLCLFCLKGGGDPPDRDEWKLDEVLGKIQEDRNLLITLQTAFNCIGGPTTQPTMYDPATRRKDLQVLQKLNLAPGDTRSAYWLLSLALPRFIPTLWNVCNLNGESGPAWKECPVAHTEAYHRGTQAGVCPVRSAEEMASAKAESCQEIEKCERLRIRAHHLLCIMAFWGRFLDEPIAADNLWEPLVRMRENPDIEVELIEGACQVCPPCSVFDPKREICDGACGLRDRLKDLNTFQRLGLAPGDVRTARELYDLIYERIDDISQICGGNNPDNIEWANCGGLSDSRFGNARLRGKPYE